MKPRLITLILACYMSLGTALAETILSARTLRVGTILETGDIVVQTESGKASQREMIGLELRRTVYAGHPVFPADLGPPTFVKRNDVVTMRFRSSALGLRTLGRALGSGGSGEVIDVMNLDSRISVRARIVAPGQVEIVR